MTLIEGSKGLAWFRVDVLREIPCERGTHVKVVRWTTYPCGRGVDVLVPWGHGAQACACVYLYLAQSAIAQNISSCTFSL